MTETFEPIPSYVPLPGQAAKKVLARGANFLPYEHSPADNEFYPTGIVILRQLASTMLLGLLLTATSLAAEPLTVTLDNEFIQSYRGHIGRWVLPEQKGIESLAAAFGTRAKDILELNDGKFTSNVHMFIPFGEQPLQTLLTEGKGRRIQKIEPRKFVWPVEAPVYTSRYGKRSGEQHPGLDFGCPRNTIVLAVDDGIVMRSGWYGGLGLAVAIQHKNGVTTWYAHNSTALLKEGEKVTRGQIIALSGSTGRSTGPHVHFEVRYMDVTLDPEDFVQFGFVRPDLVVREGPKETVRQEVGLDNVVITGSKNLPN